MQREGKIHIYTGDGKGKTTAAIGLCVRALGAGRRIFFALANVGGTCVGRAYVGKAYVGKAYVGQSNAIK